jgi:hypothetical protein
MELHGTVGDGVIVPDNAAELPVKGTRVRIEEDPIPVTKSVQNSEMTSFATQFAQYRGAILDAPADLASQHDHYRLGTPKR